MKMENEKITAWVTKYALTQGIMKVDGEVHHGTSSNMFSYGEYGYAHGDDWHRTHESAVAKAEDMRKKKIASLKKSIAKLEAMNF